MARKLSSEEVEVFFNNFGLKLFNPEKYANSSTEMECVDEDGYLYLLSYSALAGAVRQNIGIRKFAKSNPHTIDNLKNWIKINKKTFHIMSEKYISNDDHLIWHCEKCNEEWGANLSNITSKNSDCPYCAGQKIGSKNNLLFLFPSICLEWDYTKNKNLLPENFVPGSNKKFWWICKKCGYSWGAKASDRTGKKTGCPACANIANNGKNNLMALFPEIAKEFDLSKNYPKTPEDYFPESNKKLWWKCSKCGYSWGTTAQKRTRDKNGCPACSGRVPYKNNNLKYIFPSIASEWDFEKNYPKTPEDYTSKSGKKVWWICDKGHSYSCTIAHRTFCGIGCSICNQSKGEREIEKVLTNTNILFTGQYKFKDCIDINPLPFDFYLNDLNVCIEFQGEGHYEAIAVFGGVESFELRKVHDQIKHDYCFKNNIKLIAIPYWDFKNIEQILSQELNLNIPFSLESYDYNFIPSLSSLN
jgi:rubrerythrin